MKLKSLIAVSLGLSFLGFVSPAFAALPTINTFTIASTGVSPVPVTAFTASDSDGTVVGYMITTTSGKPAASDTRWTATPLTSFATSNTGVITLFAWAKDNANGVSSSMSRSTTVLAAHNHDAIYVNEGQPNSISAAMIIDGAVTGAKIAAGAVTDATITGPISGAKISSTGLNADTVDGKHAAELAAAVHTHAQDDVTGLTGALAGKADSNHNHDPSYQQHYANVITVHKGAADGVHTFDSIAAALDTITVASSDNPYLVLVMPGIYAETFIMKEWVTVRGAGRESTIIKAGSYGSLVTGANNSTLEDLTVWGIGGNAVEASTTMTIRNCLLRATWTALWAGAGSNLTLNDCELISENEHVFALNAREDSTVTITGSSLHNTTALGGGLYMYCQNSPCDIQVNVKESNIGGIQRYTASAAMMSKLTIVNSTINRSILLSGCTTPGQASVQIASSMIQSIADSCLGDIAAVNCYDSNFAAIPNQ